jgi:hypothetical protein
MSSVIQAFEHDFFHFHLAQHLYLSLSLLRARALSLSFAVTDARPLARARAL